MRLLSVIFTHYGEKMRLINKALGTIQKTRHCFLFFSSLVFSLFSRENPHHFMGREKNKSAFAYVKKFGEEKGKRHFFSVCPWVASTSKKGRCIWLHWVVEVSEAKMRLSVKYFSSSVEGKECYSRGQM